MFCLYKISEAWHMILGGYSGGYLSKVEIFNWQTGEQCLIGKQKCGLKPKNYIRNILILTGGNLIRKLKSEGYFQFELSRGEICAANIIPPANGVSYDGFFMPNT